MMRRHVTGPLRTFTIGYQDKSFSELEYAKIIAEQFETEHHVLMIEEMTEELIEKSLWHFDEPMTDLSSIPLMLICKEAKKDITVCLSGEGGDEVFVGYDRLKASKLNSYYSRLPKSLRQPLLPDWWVCFPTVRRKKAPSICSSALLKGHACPKRDITSAGSIFPMPGRTPRFSTIHSEVKSIRIRLRGCMNTM
jgi:asparagine synthase (glutamine-hydrolysing)